MKRITRPMSLEEHVEFGQAIKDAVNAIKRVIEMGNALEALEDKDIRRLSHTASANPAFDRLRCRMDGRLFSEHPYLTMDAINVYYNNDFKANADELNLLAHAADGDICISETEAMR